MSTSHDSAAPLERQVRGWDSIETAPKDGTEILCVSATGNMYVVSYDDIFAAPWRVMNDCGFREHVFTHWMPLPEAPNVEFRPLDAASSRPVEPGTEG
ncbi:MAG: DUF551 domain-containing protein [Rugosibacter sp.]|nr:DUF551 domain-containing protein [Rugosibacter sp.]